MRDVLKFLNDNKVFFISTTEAGQPRVRPFGFVMEFEEKLYFITSNEKPIYRQLKDNPLVEISACSPSMEWVRVSGKAVFSDSMAAKEKAMEIMPMLKQLYQGGAADPRVAMFYLTDTEASFCSMTAAPKVYKF